MTARDQRLEDVCEITMGQAPAGESYNMSGEGLPLIAGAGDFSGSAPKATKFTRVPSKVCARGDIVLGIRASIGEKVLADRDYCLGRGVAGIRASGDTDPRFLWHWLTWAAPQLIARGKGATFKQVSRSDISDLPISVPPPASQRRIAEVLDRADALRAKRRASIAQLDALTQSIFLDMFGGGRAQTWPTNFLGEIAEIQGGLQVSSARERLAVTVPYLRVANVYRGFLKLSEIKSLKATDAEVARTRLVAGDLLVVEGHGNPAEIGRAALWDGSISSCVHQNHLIRVRLDPRQIVPLYACMYINSREGRRHLLRSGKSTSGLNTISVSEVRATPMLVPPLDLQKKLVTRIGLVTRLRMKHFESLETLNALFASLQHRAFRGEL